MAIAVASTAHAQAGDCLTANPPAPEPGRVNFGITPGIAGSAGVGQGTAVPVDRKAERAALVRLVSSVEAVAAHAGDLGITDYRWFNLRDNDSDGVDLFSQVGLLRDDYSEKPAFAEYRAAIRRLGRR